MVFAIAALISAEEAVEEELIPIKQARKHSLVMTGARKYLFTRCIVNKPKYDRSKGASLSLYNCQSTDDAITTASPPLDEK